MADQPVDPVRDALEKVGDAIAEYAQAAENVDEGKQVVVTASVIMYEMAYLDEAGDYIYRVRYSFPRPLSMSAAAGLVVLGSAAVEDDLGGSDHGDDD